MIRCACIPTGACLFTRPGRQKDVKGVAHLEKHAMVAAAKPRMSRTVRQMRLILCFEAAHRMGSGNKRMGNFEKE